MNRVSRKIMDAIGDENSAVLITSEANRRYISGFHSSDGFVLITGTTLYLLVDARYYEAAKEQSLECEVVLLDGLEKTVRAILKKEHIKKLFIESDFVTVKGLSLLRKLSVEIISDDTLANIINSARIIKNQYEIDKIKESQRITDEAFSYILEKLRPGLSEKEIAIELEFFMRRNGAQKAAFDFIVVSGKRTALPHGEPSSKVIEKGDLVTIDMGAVLDGYHSDMTRTVAINEISDEKKEIYNLVLEAQLTALKTIKPGVCASDVHSSASKIIGDAGYADCFKHGTGHGVGLEIHEHPYLNRRSDEILRPGMVVTVEPGIYIGSDFEYEAFGVRIEDMVYITEHGFENLTSSNKNLTIV